MRGAGRDLNPDWLLFVVSQISGTVTDLARLSERTINMVIQGGPVRAMLLKCSMRPLGLLQPRLAVSICEQIVITVCWSVPGHETVPTVKAHISAPTRKSGVLLQNNMWAAAVLADIIAPQNWGQGSGRNGHVRRWFWTSQYGILASLPKCR